MDFDGPVEFARPPAAGQKQLFATKPARPRTAAGQTLLVDSGVSDQPVVRPKPEAAMPPEIAAPVQPKPLPGQGDLFGEKQALEPVHHAVGKRFGIPPEAVKDFLETSPAELARRDDYNAESNTTEPTEDFERFPANSARIASFQHRIGNPHEAYVSYLRDFDPHELMPAEHEDGIKKSKSFADYLQWAKQGKKPPYINVYSQTNGNPQLLSGGRRRTLAAQDAGVPSITGWHGPHNAETGNPLKYGDILRAAKEFSGQQFSRDISEIGPVEFSWDESQHPRFQENASPYHRGEFAPKDGGNGHELAQEDAARTQRAVQAAAGKPAETFAPAADTSLAKPYQFWEQSPLSQIIGNIPPRPAWLRQRNRTTSMDWTEAHEAAQHSAEKYEVSIDSVVAQMPEAHTLMLEGIIGREEAKKQAREITGLTAGRINQIENANRDWTSLTNRFDETSREFASLFPDIGINPDDLDTPQQVWDFIREGKLTLPKQNSREVADLAASMLASNRRRNEDVHFRSDEDDERPVEDDDWGYSGDDSFDPSQFSRAGESDEITRIAARMGVDADALRDAISEVPGGHEEALIWIRKLMHDPSRGVIRDRSGRVVGFLTRNGTEVQIRDGSSRPLGTVRHGHDRATFRDRQSHMGGSVGEFSRVDGPVEFARIKPAGGQKSLGFDEPQESAATAPAPSPPVVAPVATPKSPKVKPVKPEFTDGGVVDWPQTNTWPPMAGVRVRHGSDGDTRFIHPTDDSYTMAKVATPHVMRFLDEIRGKLDHEPNSGHSTLDRVLSGQGKFIGKGHEGMAFDAGNGMVVKASVLTPFHIGQGMRTPEEANKIVDDSVAVSKALRSRGVPGIIPQYGVSHEGRSFAVQKKVDTQAPLQEHHIKQLEQTIQGMHNAGYLLRDEVQAGLDHNGNAAIYDVGSATRTGQQKPEWDREDMQGDFGRLSRLASKHGIKYTKPFDRDQVSHYVELLEKAHDEGMTPGNAIMLRTKLKGIRPKVLERDPSMHEWTTDMHNDAMDKLHSIIKPTVQMSRQPRFEPSDVEHYIDTIRRNVSMRIPRQGETPENTWHSPEFTARHEATARKRFVRDNVHLADVPVGLLNYNPGEVAPERQARLEAAGGTQDPVIVGVDAINGNSGQKVLNVDDGNNRVHYAKQHGITHIPAFLHGDPDEIEAARQMIANPQHHQFSRKPGSGQQSSDWDEAEHPRAANGKFSGKLHHAIKEFLSDGTRRNLRDIHAHTGHEATSMFDPMSNPTNAALKELRDSGEITATEPQYGEPMFHMTEEQRKSHRDSLYEPEVEPTEEFSRDDFSPVEFARKPAAGQATLDFDAPPREYNRETSFHETKRPGEFAPAEKPKKDKPTTLRDEHGRVIHPTTGQVQARKGGEVSEVDGQHYKAGHWMPVHGLTPKAEAKPKAIAADADSSAGKANEHAADKSRRYTEARVLSPEDLGAAQLKKAHQQKWTEMNSGPLGKVKWIGDSPNAKGMHWQTSMNGWNEFAEKAGPAEMTRIISELEPIWHARVDAAAKREEERGQPLDSDTIEWQRNTPREAATGEMQLFPRANGFTEKRAPGSAYARQLVHSLLDQEHFKPIKPDQHPVDNMHDIHRILSGTYESEFSRQSAIEVEFSRHEFASTQLNISDAGYSRSDGSPIGALKELAKSIPDDELAEDGREDEFHVTALYGLHGEDAEEIANLVSGFGPVKIVFGETSLFPADDKKDHDVVKIDIKGDDIHRLHKLLKKLDHTSTYPEYKPHLTLAYCKAGEGAKYCGKNPLTGKEATFTRLMFSNKDRSKTPVSLIGESEFSRTSAEETPHDRIMRVMGQIEPGAANGALISARQLRKHAGMDKPSFDKTVFELARQKRIMAHKHDFATSLPPHELDELVDTAHGDPERAKIHANDGRYWVGVAMRRQPAEFSRGVNWVYAPEPAIDSPVEFARRRQPDPSQNSFGWTDEEQETPVESSNVHSYAWHGSPATGSLLVRFHAKDGKSPGPIYEYLGTPHEMYSQMATAPSKGSWVWDALRVRGSVSGHQYPYRLYGVGTGGYIPRQAVIGLRGKNGQPSTAGEHFVTRRFQGQESQLAPAPVRRSGGKPIPGYDINKLSMPGENSLAQPQQPQPQQPALPKPPQNPATPVNPQNPPTPSAPKKPTLIERVLGLFRRKNKPKQFSRETVRDIERAYTAIFRNEP